MKLSSLFLIGSLAWTGAVAQYEDLSLDDLLELKITTGSFLDLDLSKSPLSMTVISKDQVQRSGSRNLSELLEIYVPGFQYMYNKWNGEIWGMRGVAADRNTKILFLVNGHKMNMESRDGAMSEISLGLLGDIQRVEVLRGPAGLVYGSGAIAGIINVVTDRHEDKDKLDNVSVALGTYDLNTTNSEVNATVHRKTEDDNFTLDIGYRESQGTGQERSRIYGRASWPYPQWLDNPPANGTPSAGSALSTPGNYKIGLDWEHKGLRLYTRFTHQVENAGGLFVVDPWPEAQGTPTASSSILFDTLSQVKIASGDQSRPAGGYLVKSEASTTRVKVGGDTVQVKADTTEIWATPASTGNTNRSTALVDGEQRTLDSWYGSAESGNTNRRQYVIDNIMSELSYTVPFGDNELRLKGSLDGATNRIQREDRKGNEAMYPTERHTFVEETFGERRYTLNGTYLLKSVNKLQLASGYEWRMDQIGDDLTGKNSQAEKADHQIVSDVTYFNNAVFFEGLYNLRDNLDLHGGMRWDGHTRTIDQKDAVFHVPGVISPKASIIYTPILGHTIKAMFQSAANNGSADNYEYNRNSMDDAGQAYATYHFEKPYEIPGQNSTPIPGVSTEELHQLSPERIWSMELASHHDLFRKTVVFAPSISYNTVSDLFAWNQAKFRVVNTGAYHFVTAEMELSYTSDKLTIGFNHAYQNLVNTNVAAQEEVSVGPSFDQSGSWYQELTDANGKTYYVPTPTSYADTIRFNAVKDQISVDGSSFLNLVPHISKLYFDYEFLPHVVLHSDLRVFWGLQGRKSIQNYKKTTTITGSTTTIDTTYVIQTDNTVSMETDTTTTNTTTTTSTDSSLDDRGYTDNTVFNYLDIDSRPMFKWNASIHWTPTNDLTVSAFVYDILGVDNGTSTDNSLAINTLRWQQSGNSKEQTDLFGTDLRSYAIRISKNF